MQVRKAEKLQQNAEKRSAELRELLLVEKGNVAGLEERLQIAQVSALSTAAPLRAVEQQCRELQGKLKELQGVRMSDGRQIAQLRRQIDASPPVAGTPRQLDVVNAARVTAERQLSEIKAMLHSPCNPPPRPPSPESVILGALIPNIGRDPPSQNTRARGGA